MAATLNGAATEAAQQMLIAQALKNGKSPEQKRVIDFFFSQCKEGGCLSKSYNLTMDEYLKLVQDKVNNLNTKAKAIEKIGLDESEISEIEPIALASFVYDDDVHIKVEDGVAVSSQYALTWIFFSATQIYTYKYIFDTTSDNTWEFTNDFFYTDVTCLTTLRRLKEKIDAVTGKGCLSSGIQYVHNNYVVDTFEIIVPGTSYSFSMRNGESYESSIQAAKQMLREKKFNK
jgi:hypothetical protein